jgi:hypothetical protein
MSWGNPWGGGRWKSGHPDWFAREQKEFQERLFKTGGGGGGGGGCGKLLAFCFLAFIIWAIMSSDKDHKGPSTPPTRSSEESNRSSQRPPATNPRVLELVNDIGHLSGTHLLVARSGERLYFEGTLPNGDFNQDFFRLADLDLPQSRYFDSNHALEIPCKAYARCVFYYAFDPFNSRPKEQKGYTALSLRSPNDIVAQQILADFKDLSNLSAF